MKEGYVLKADAAKHLTPEPITYEAMKRKSEKAAQTALKDAKASILNAAGIVQILLVNCIGAVYTTGDLIQIAADIAQQVIHFSDMRVVYFIYKSI